MLDVALLAYKEPNSAGYDVIKVGEVVYYAKAADAKIKADKSEVPDIPAAGVELTLTLPVNASIAYPGLATKGIGLTALFAADAALADLTNGQIELKVTGAVSGPTKKTYKIKIGFETGADVYVAMRKLDAAKTKTLTIKLGFKGAKRAVPDLPSLNVAAPG